jgi:hypothetical protein
MRSASPRGADAGHACGTRTVCNAVPMLLGRIGQGLAIAVVALLLVSCRGAAPPSLPSGAPSGESVVDSGCGDVSAQLCTAAATYAPRLAPAGTHVVAVEMTPFQPVPGLECEGPCPSADKGKYTGALLRFSDRDPLQLDCWSLGMSHSFTDVLKDEAVCFAVDPSERRSIKLHTRVHSESDTAADLFVVSGSGTSINPVFAGQGGGCGMQLTSVPFSFGLSDTGAHGEPVGEYREVFRSEELGMPDLGASDADDAEDLSLDITIEPSGGLKVELMDKRPRC